VERSLLIPKAILQSHFVWDFLFSKGFGGRVVLGEKEAQDGGIIFEEKFSLAWLNSISAELVFIVDLYKNI
jgi:hypothetical protein